MISPIRSAGLQRPEHAQAYHNIFSGVYRMPFGAVPTGSFVTLRVYAAESQKLSAVYLRVWADNAETFYPMRSCGALWETVYPVPDTPQVVWYRFDLHLTSGDIAYCQPDANAYDGIWHSACNAYASFQLTVYDAAFSVPDWTSDGILYQIFPDRFFRSAAETCDTTGKRMHASWTDPVDYLPDPAKGYYPADDFFGGNLRGIEEKLPYLKLLGVTALYLNPIFKAYSNHRYDTGDYSRIDPLLGSNDDFQRLCCATRAVGIRIICDGVFSHTGADSLYFNRSGTYPPNGACDSPDSPYFKWYRFRKYPTDYECWWDIWSLPDVDETEPSYLAFITGPDGIARRWLAAGASGWRLDVADELPDRFLECFRQAVKSADRDAWIVGEVWEDASNKVSYGAQRRFLLGRQLDSVMNYPLRTLILDLLAQRIDAAAFCLRLAQLASNYPTAAFYACMNFLSTHDVCRITTMLGASHDLSALTRAEQAQFRLTAAERQHALRLHRLAILLLFSLPGMPCIYYGDEIGMEGCADPFNRAPFAWQKTDGSDAQSLLAFYSAAAALRSASPALRRGELQTETVHGLLLIRRRFAAETMLTVINATSETLALPAFAGKPLLSTASLADASLPPFSGVICSIS